MKNILVLTILVISSATYADINDIRKFKKCYALFTSRSLTPGHPMMASVIANNMSGEQACKQLLEKANLGSNNKISGGASNREAQRVLRNFQYLHRSFFQVQNYKSRSDMNDAKYVENLHDTNSDGYFWTYAMFKPGADASSVLTSNHTYAALRKAKGTGRMSRALDGSSANLTFGWQNATPVEKGLLEGIKVDDRSFTFDPNNQNVSRHYSEFLGQNGNENLGGGVIGSQTYIFSNFIIHGIRQRQNGGSDTRRRWAKHAVEDLLCRGFPALRFSDVVDEVKVNSNLAYRQSGVCMGCHSTMDYVAGNMRNVVTTGRFGTAGKPLAAFPVPVSEPVQRDGDRELIAPELGNDSDYYKRPPKGRLKYRSYNGELVNVLTNNLTDLGAAMANTNDFYVCAAKKYYKFLTGIEVSLEDLTDPGAPVALSPLEIKHRERVIALGLELKQTQNIQNLVNKVIETKTFISPEVFE